MALNNIQPGHTLVLTLAEGAASGQLVEAGDLLAVAMVNIPVNGYGACAVSGVWALPKESGEAIAQGKKVYATVDMKITATSGADTAFAGYATEAAASGDALVHVLLNGMPGYRA